MNNVTDGTLRTLKNFFPKENTSVKVEIRKVMDRADSKTIEVVRDVLSYVHNKTPSQELVGDNVDLYGDNVDLYGDNKDFCF